MKTIDWSARFNALPDDVRTIGCAMEARTRIQQLLAEKVRLLQRYRTSIEEIEESISYNEQFLKNLEPLP